MITDLHEETHDIDWFAVDRSGQIAHFASGGRGFIPASVKQLSEDDFDFLGTYFRTLLPQRSDVQVAESFAPYEPTFRCQEDREAYLRGFWEMARRGVYSYDCVVLPIRPSGYFLVMEPLEPLRIDELSASIRSILERTRCRDAFLDRPTIASEQIA